MANIRHLLDKIRKAIYGKEVRGSLADGLEAVNNEVEDATEVAVNVEQRQDAVEQQFNTLLGEWSDDKPIDNAETIAARTNTKESKTYENLGKRLDEEYGKVTSQLADTANRSFYGNLMQHKKPKKLITILDDDGRIDLYNIMYPTIKRLGIKMTAAIITERVDNPDSPGTINLDQYYEMLNSGYIEMISHSATHRHLAQMPIEEAEHELKSSKEWILRHGGNPDYFVYPFNSKNPAVIEKTREYYKGAFSTTGIINQTPLDSLLIDRVDFDRDASYLKGKIDELDANGGWLVFNSHAWYDSVTDDFIEEIVDYGLNKGIEFVTVGEAMKHFGNIIDTEFGVLGANGETTGIFEHNLKFIIGTSTNITNNTPLHDFYPRCITRMHFTRSESDARGFPEPGIYEVDRTSDDFSRSHYYPYKTIGFYTRFWDRDSGKWADWEYVNLGNTLSKNDITSQTTPNEMPRKYFETIITPSAATGFPEERAGLLKTDIRGGSGMEFQEYRPIYRDVVYRRHWTSAGWTDWKGTNIS